MVSIVCFRLRGIVIFVLHMLAFVEFPSSLSWTSDIKSRGERLTLPCGVTEGMELVCLLLLLGDVIIKVLQKSFRLNLV